MDTIDVDGVSGNGIEDFAQKWSQAQLVEKYNTDIVKICESYQSRDIKYYNKIYRENKLKSAFSYNIKMINKKALAGGLFYYTVYSKGSFLKIH